MGLTVGDILQELDGLPEDTPVFLVTDGHGRSKFVEHTDWVGYADMGEGEFEDSVSGAGVYIASAGQRYHNPYLTSEERDALDVCD